MPIGPMQRTGHRVRQRRQPAPRTGQPAPLQRVFPRWPEDEVPSGYVTNGVHVAIWAPSATTVDVERYAAEPPTTDTESGASSCASRCAARRVARTHHVTDVAVGRPTTSPRPARRGIGREWCRSSSGRGEESGRLMRLPHADCGPTRARRHLSCHRASRSVRKITERLTLLQVNA